MIVVVKGSAAGSPAEVKPTLRKLIAKLAKMADASYTAQALHLPNVFDPRTDRPVVSKPLRITVPTDGDRLLKTLVLGGGSVLSMYAVANELNVSMRVVDAVCGWLSSALSGFRGSETDAIYAHKACMAKLYEE
jgi:hypothetical protein